MYPGFLQGLNWVQKSAKQGIKCRHCQRPFSATSVVNYNYVTAGKNTTDCLFHWAFMEGQSFV